MFTIPIEDLQVSDIEALVNTTKLSENDRIEYKETLPALGTNCDNWINGEDSIGDYALKKITKEIVAFSNTHGGTLIIGIAEDGGSPPRPDSINFLPRCEQLEQRLMQSIADRIEPRLDNLQSKSVLNGTEGVIVIKIPRSEHAPHRSKSDKEFYVRERDQSRTMTPYEIKSLSIKRSRQKIEALWSVVFSMQDTEDVNGGVVIFEEGKIYGGDSQYYYHGIYELIGDTKISGYLSVNHYHGPVYTAFGTAESNISVIVQGDLLDDTVTGQITHSATGGSIPFRMDRKTNLI